MYIHIYIWNLKQPKENTKFIEKRQGEEELVEGSQKVQTSSSKVNKSYKWDVQHGDYS